MKKIFAILLVMCASVSTAHANEILTLQPYDRVYGDPDAPITIVEYASLSCPHCADFHLNMLPKLKEKYVDSGQVNFLVRNFPTNEPAMRGAMLAQCVPQDKYYSFMKTMFTLQQKWAMSMDFKQGLEMIARVGGIPTDEFERCVSDEALEKEVLAVRRSATDALNIQATPTFFINGEKLQGADYNEFVTVIDRQLDARFVARDVSDDALAPKVLDVDAESLPVQAGRPE